MALTIAIRQTSVFGNMRAVAAQVTFDDSYPSGGESLTAAMLGLSEIHKVFPDAYDATSAALMYDYDYANSKLQAFFPTGGAASAPTTVIDPVVAVPSGSTAVTSESASPNLTETPGRGKEVGSTCNLSTIILRVFVIGC